MTKFCNFDSYDLSLSSSIASIADDFVIPILHAKCLGNCLADYFDLAPILSTSFFIHNNICKILDQQWPSKPEFINNFMVVSWACNCHPRNLPQNFLKHFQVKLHINPYDSHIKFIYKHMLFNSTSNHTHSCW